MSRMQLTSKTRTDFRKSVTKAVRREGNIPATVYGKGFEPVSVAVSGEEFAALLKTPGGRLSIIDLKVEDAKSKKPVPVMIQELQRDPISKQILHIDFHQIKMDEPVHAPVPIRVVGDAPGVKMGGILEQLLREIEIKALPDHMPTHIDVDVSGLELGDSIHVSGLQLPADAVVLQAAPETLVVAVRQPVVRVEEVAAPEAAEEGAAPEAAAETPAEGA